MLETLVPVIVLAVILAIDAWVYQDAKRCTNEGAPVVFRLGAFVVDTPTAWFIGCLVLWIIFFPLYIVSRESPT